MSVDHNVLSFLFVLTCIFGLYVFYIVFCSMWMYVCTCMDGWISMHVRCDMHII